MNKRIVPILSASCISLAAVAQTTWTPAAARNYPASANYEASSPGFYESWIEGKLSLGLTFSTFNLTDGKRPPNREEDFLGNINELRESHPSRLLPILEYQACDYLALGLSYMHIEASTMNFNNGEGDGNVVMKGPTVAADLTYPLFEKRLYPHVGVGLAFLSGDFEEDTWWHLGYSSPESWATLGSSHKDLRGNHYRYIDVDDETSVFFTIGLSFLPHPRVKLDISYRWIDIDPDCEFGYNFVGPRLYGKDKHSDGDFDVSSEILLISASYVF